LTSNAGKARVASVPITPAHSRTATVRAAVLLAAARGALVLIWAFRPTTGVTSPVGGIVAGCGWLAWALAGWLAVTVAGCAASHLCGSASNPVRRPKRALDRCVPRRLGRCVDAVITAGLAATVLGGAVVPASADPVRPAAATRHEPIGGPLDWPGLTDSGSPAQSSATPAVGLVSTAPTRVNHGDRVTVRAGDSLWSLAATHLGSAATTAQIATAWPRWYAANRKVIGADPALIHPGQRLRPPVSEATNHPPARDPGSSS
jgi:LysM repeat protein